MRIRMNFTLDLDVEQYCEAMDQDLTKVEVRERVQEQCIASIMRHLIAKGVDVELLGRNNVYDPIQKLTVAEHLVTSS
jgi:hypothetical protein